MHRVLAAELSQHIGREVTVKGWLHNLRLLGKIAFLILRDRTGYIQIVIEDKEQVNQLKAYQVGTVLKASGKAAAAKTEAGAEISQPQLEVISLVTEPLPIDLTKNEIAADLDTILDHRPLTLRHQRSQAVFKIQAEIAAAYREFLRGQGFTEFFGPNIISASSEGGAELFTVNYFDHEAKLSQSAQLYKQIMVGAYERVFALMKCFRAEKSATRRHLTEATQMEFEMGFIEDFSEVMDMLEAVIKYIVKQIQTNCAKELAILGVELALAPQANAFPRVTFHDALEIYFKRTGIDERHEIDLSPGAERELCAYAREEFGTDFIFVTHFLRKKTAFYAMPNAENPEVCNYFDLLCREIEIVSGGQRIHEHDMLVESLQLKGMDPAAFTDYLSIFKHGMPPHGGFGMGFERLTMMLLGLENIRETTLFPSDTKRVAGVSLAAKVYSGGENIRDEIVKRLTNAGIEFKHMEHEETPTSEDAARVRNIDLSEGVKAIILQGKKSGKLIMMCVPGDQKVDLAKVTEVAGEKFEFAKPELIASKFGLKTGGVPPFGNLLAIETYFDSSLKDKKRWAFNCGLRTESILIEDAKWFEIAESRWV